MFQEVLLCRQLKPRVLPASSAAGSTSTARTSSPTASTSAPVWMGWWAACPSALTRFPCPPGVARGPAWPDPTVAAARSGCVTTTTTSVRSQTGSKTRPDWTTSTSPTTSVPCCRSSLSRGSRAESQGPHSEVNMAAHPSQAFSVSRAQFRVTQKVHLNTVPVHYHTQSTFRRWILKSFCCIFNLNTSNSAAAKLRN